MRWSLDCEFNAENRSDIDLISIGLACEDGRTYYAISNEFDLKSCGWWLQQNVLPKLDPIIIGVSRSVWKSRSQIAKDIRELICSDREAPEIWTYFGAYDWVAFCQLFGGMLHLPSRVPQQDMDLKQRMNDLGVKRSDLPEQNEATLHHALFDALWQMNCLKHLDARWQGAPKL